MDATPEFWKAVGDGLAIFFTFAGIALVIVVWKKVGRDG